MVVHYSSLARLKSQTRVEVIRVTNPLAYFANESISAVKSFITQAQSFPRQSCPKPSMLIIDI